MSKRKSYSSHAVRGAYWSGKNKGWDEAEKFFARMLPGWKKTLSAVGKGKLKKATRIF